MEERQKGYGARENRYDCTTKQGGGGGGGG